MKQQILDFWFGPAAPDEVVARRQATLWWGADERLDCTVAARFGEALDQAAAGDPLFEDADGEGRLALILLLDQFPRNIYRGTRRAFAQDARALALCRDGLSRGLDAGLPPLRRTFFYMPLEHAESADMQDLAVRYFAALTAAAPAAARPVFEEHLDFARRHQAVIARFGRFPHRNVILGRASTPAEAEFLREEAAGF